jgi:hypothetical protein
MRRFESVALLGAALLLGALFVPWYLPADGAGDFPGTALAAWDTWPWTGWKAFTVVDVALAVLAAASTRSRTAAVAAAGLVVYRMLDPPGTNAAVDLAPGPWLALAGALLAATAILKPSP